MEETDEFDNEKRGGWGDSDAGQGWTTTTGADFVGVSIETVDKTGQPTPSPDDLQPIRVFNLSEVDPWNTAPHVFLREGDPRLEAWKEQP